MPQDYSIVETFNTEYAYGKETKKSRITTSQT